MFSIDIIVPTFNRPLDIKKFIEEIQKQNFDNFKVFIVDDHGEENIENIIPKNKHFEFIRLEKNIGQAGVRNIAIEQGSGDIIISLDDDAWFMDDPEAFLKVIDYFQHYPDMGCLMFNILEPGKEILSERANLQEGQEIGFHITCGCAYSRKALEEIGGFSEFFHSGAEESDITFKLIKKGYKLYFSENIRVFHNYQPGKRSKAWYRKLRKNTTRNDLLIVLMYYPAFWIPIYFFGKWLSHLRFSFFNKRDRWGATHTTFVGGYEAIGFISKTMDNRNPLTIQEFKDWLKVRW